MHLKTKHINVPLVRSHTDVNSLINILFLRLRTIIDNLALYLLSDMLAIFQVLIIGIKHCKSIISNMLSERKSNLATNQWKG